jgi:RHS repeat-associated protein
MFDGNGNKTWEADLDIYGRVRTFAGRSLDECPFRYQGQYEDSETGLYYNRFRYYDPDSGNYISQDPIGLAGGNPTLYGYVKDVNSFVDHYGLMLALPAPRGSNPWKEGVVIESVVVPKGGWNVEMAMSPGQTKPGSWATFDHIPDVDYVRNKLAVTPEFKGEISHVQVFHIPEGTRVQIGTVGPQIHKGITYPGGGTQIQILNKSDLDKLEKVGRTRDIH